MSATVEVSVPAPAAVRAEAPLTLDEPPPRVLGFWDQFGLWANLGVSLLGPVGALGVLAPFGFEPLPLAGAALAVVVGTVLGTLLVAVATVPGAQTGAPSMVLLRGLFGRRVSYLPTVLNVLQLVGWEKSQGIRGEIEFMQSLGRPVKYIIPEIEDISIAVDIPAPKEIDTPLVSLEVIVDYMATQLGMSYDSIAELLTDYGLEECCWCRENAPAGCKPSFYIKKPEEMSGAVDRELGGHLCKECAAAAEEEERRRAEEGKA
jgi:hypothetical protein